MATDLTYPNVQEFTNAEAFDSDIEFAMFESGAWRKKGTAIIRQLLSTSLFISGTADPTADNIIADTTVWFVNTTDSSLHVSLAGTNFIEIATATTPLSGLQIVALLAGLSGDDMLPASAIRDLPEVTSLTEEQVRDVVALFVVGGDGIEAQHNDGADTLTLSLHASQVVSVLEGLQGNNRLNASAVRNLPSGGGPTLNVAARPPAAGDLIAGTDYIWVDIASGTFHLSVSGSAWQTVTPTATVSLTPGVYTVFGTWTWGSASTPTTGGFYVGQTGIVFNGQDADGNDKTTNITDLEVGDRLQVGEVNAFDITSAATAGTGNAYLINGVWQENYVGGDFDGNMEFRLIKKNNIVVQGNVKPGSVLRINDELSIEADDPEDALVDLWTGTIGTNEANTNYDINAGELFSDYSHVIFNYSGSNYRNVKEAPVKLWQLLTRIEVSNKTNSMAVRRIDNNTFRIEAVTGTIKLRAIHGYKGV